MRYRVPEGPLNRLMVAGGVVHVADRFTARDNVVVAPAYTRLDGSASYELPGSRFTHRSGRAESHEPSLCDLRRGRGVLRRPASPRRGATDIGLLEHFKSV